MYPSNLPYKAHTQFLENTHHPFQLFKSICHPTTDQT